MDFVATGGIHVSQTAPRLFWYYIIEILCCWSLIYICIADTASQYILVLHGWDFILLVTDVFTIYGCETESKYMLFIICTFDKYLFR